MVTILLNTIVAWQHNNTLSSVLSNADITNSYYVNGRILEQSPRLTNLAKWYNRTDYFFPGGEYGKQ